jgi:chemosensory pili system protein ChpA (sensor histidine kinase/response regulator)
MKKMLECCEYEQPKKGPMIMAKFPKAELLELFIQEVDSYLPGIQQGLEALSSDRTALTAIEELHRLFHNIKGAASQVQLFDLSHGAKVVESALDALLEKEQPVSDHLLRALNQTAECLIAYCKDKEYFQDEGQKFHEQIVSIFEKHQEDDSHKNYLHEIRSIFPLLQELASCLTEDGNDTKHDSIVYGKLSHAVSILSATVLAGGMKQQSLLMQDFHHLLENLHNAAIPARRELSGLMQDFLQFLEVIFAHQDPENSVCLRRVKGQLQRLEALMVLTDQKEERDALFVETTQFDATDIFDDSSTDQILLEKRRRMGLLMSQYLRELNR